MTEDVAIQEFWDELRKTTQARIGLGRAGNALPTREVLELSAAHAAARDAVHEPLDVDDMVARVRQVGIGEPAVVRSQAESRSEYLRRPDLGRLPAAPMDVPETPADIGFVLADGLSPYALAKHGPALLAELVAALRDDYTLAPPVIATQARVALGDHIGAAAKVRTLLVIIGERPGLSVADSLDSSDAPAHAGTHRCGPQLHLQHPPARGPRLPRGGQGRGRSGGGCPRVGPVRRRPERHLSRYLAGSSGAAELT